jgi:uncharacterized protein with GYD domain
MATYLIYTQWTEQGIRNIKDSPKRLDLGKNKLKEMGGEMKAFYMTQGHYDSVAIVEIPNDEALAKYVLWLSSQGNLRTHTVKAYTEEEYRRILSGLS